jgi:hypothetical protein
MLGLLIPLLVSALVVSWVVRNAHVAVDGGYVEDWAQAHALELTPRNRPMVHWYLHTARLLRTLGALAGFFLPPLLGSAFGSQALKDASFPLVFVGYFAGAIYAELALVRPAGDRRVAVLAPREVSDYLPRRLLVAQLALPALAVVAGVAPAFLGYDRDARSGFNGSPRLLGITMAVIAVVVGLALERVERWLVQRPQPFSTTDMLAADDAIRSQSVHSVAGSGLAIVLASLATGLFALARSDVQLLRWTMPFVALACFFGSIWVCLHYGHRAWRVRRSLPVTAAAR